MSFIIHFTNRIGLYLFHGLLTIDVSSYKYGLILETGD